MGALFMYSSQSDEKPVPRRFDSTQKIGECDVEVVDCHGVPELRVGPVGEAHTGYIAEFRDWDQFTRFVEGVVDLHDRLRGSRPSVRYSGPQPS